MLHAKCQMPSAKCQLLLPNVVSDSDLCGRRLSISPKCCWRICVFIIVRSEAWFDFHLPAAHIFSIIQQLAAIVWCFGQKIKTWQPNRNLGSVGMWKESRQKFFATAILCYIICLLILLLLLRAVRNFKYGVCFVWKRKRVSVSLFVCLSVLFCCSATLLSSATSTTRNEVKQLSCRSLGKGNAV